MNNSIKNKIIIAVLCGIAYLTLSLPLRDVLSVFTVTEVRPAAVLNPFLGICFGLPAVIGVMIGNFIADAISNYSIAVLLEGLVPQFLYTYVPYLLWRYLNKGEDHIHRLNSVKRVFRYTIVIFTYAVISGLGVAMIVQLNFGADFLNCAIFTFLNNFTMAMVLGCPLMIVANQVMSRKYGTLRNLSVNEKIIIAAAICELLIIIFIIFANYRLAYNQTVYDIWNSIFMFSVIAINGFMVLVFFIMGVIESYQKAKNIK